MLCYKNVTGGRRWVGFKGQGLWIESYWLITQKLFLGSRIEKILYKPHEIALKMLSFDGNIICITWGRRGAYFRALKQKMEEPLEGEVFDENY